MNDYIQFKDFSFQYKAQAEPTLYDINLSISKGEKVLIIGPSGSGKSTLAQCINGIIPNIYTGEATGTFNISGEDAFGQSIYDKSHLVSTVLQDTDGQFVGLSVAEDLAFALENDVIPQSEMREKVQYWAEKLDLLDLLDHRPQDLSGGQKQRVSLAGVLIDESPILLFDEPLANLDPKSGQDTIDLIDRMHNDIGATTIIIEHRLEDVLYRPVDRVILINEGRILYNGNPDDLLSSDLLKANGIREPLYVTTLRHLGNDVANMEGLSRPETMKLEEVNFSPVDPAIQMPHREPLLEVEHLNFAYKPDKPILKDMSITINKGERLAIVGKNGAGKSTFAKALCQFIPAQGDIRYNGESIVGDSIKERAERVGYVLQNPNQMISQTQIFDEVALGLRLRGVDEDEIKERVYETLKVCGLYPFRDWPISALSYGQKKRVTIASILILKPEIILLDEPTAGQDQKNYTEIMNFLDDLNRQGTTIVMITHDMQLMLEYSDRAVVITDGQIIADDRPVEILSQEDIVKKAYLKITSIFQLAKRLNLDPVELTDFTIVNEGGIAE